MREAEPLGGLPQAPGSSAGMLRGSGHQRAPNTAFPLRVAPRCRVLGSYAFCMVVLLWRCFRVGLTPYPQVFKLSFEICLSLYYWKALVLFLLLCEALSFILASAKERRRENFSVCLLFICFLRKKTPNCPSPKFERKGIVPSRHCLRLTCAMVTIGSNYREFIATFVTNPEVLVGFRVFWACKLCDLTNDIERFDGGELFCCFMYFKVMISFIWIFSLEKRV